MTVSFDTNVIIRLFVNDDPARAEAAVAALEKHNRVEMADLAIVESVFVLTKHFNLSRSVVCKLITMLLEHPKISCNRPLFQKALQLYEAHPAQSIEDCCLSVYAHLNNSKPLLTFDKPLARQIEYAEHLDY